jgi:hypothetical protein
VSREYSKKFLKRMGDLSAALKRLGEEAGMKRGKFIALVDRVAREKKLKRWCDTESPLDYILLFEAVQLELQSAKNLR